ncbi:hypothetical protein HCCG_00816 [Helicobacter cinaedi CCUG 18818 = ATCC BAA-847]|uniref:Uncharacterized protein n=1 Tax=Helicobacter cinaedi CCUG 18818 = ATCC BAA-847 TaxID=537971 RepID=A0ABN0B9P0_9HELI|nr:hypothetical protein HCCG_00816 [Helicobacter cinaedi CCUG 18818 = ATCC BAA-847]
MYQILYGFENGKMCVFCKKLPAFSKIIMLLFYFLHFGVKFPNQISIHSLWSFSNVCFATFF